MLYVTHDRTRPKDEGQYYVELIEINHANPAQSNRLGYWRTRSMGTWTTIASRESVALDHP